MRCRLVAILLAFLTMSLSAAAQEQRGSIEGVVKDVQGGAAPGAVVVAKNASGLRLEAVTNAAGAYRFPALPPGKWEITASLSGFTPARVDDVSLALGQLLTVNLALTVGPMVEVIQVTAESPLIDVKQSARATSLRDEAIDKMPKSRDFLSLVTQAPGANAEMKSSGVMIDGSASGENRYLIDGAEVTNMQNGQAARMTFGQAGAVVLVPDFIEEVQVKSSGYSAEFGGATGGVISAVTKSGSNDWRGGVVAYYSGSDLDAAPRSTLRRLPTDTSRAEYITFEKDSFSRWEPGFTLGGPVIPDKVWFFAGYNPAFQPLDRTSSLSDGSVVTKRQDFRGDYATANLTAQLSKSLRVKTAFNMNRSRISGALPDQALLTEAGTTSPSAIFDAVSIRPQYTIGGSLDYTPSPRLYMSLRGGWNHSNVHSENIPDVVRYLFVSSNVGMAGVPSQYQHPTNYSNVLTNNAITRDLQSRTAFQWDTTYYFSGGGDHQLKFGAQFDRIANDVFSGEQQNLVRISWNRSLAGERGTYGYYQVRAGGSALPNRGFTTLGQIHSDNWGLFIQDQWTIRRKLTLNLGLRTENEHVPSFADPTYGLPEVAIKFGFRDKLAPRAGFSYDVKGDGKWKAYGSWGIFYDIMKLEMPRGSFGGDKWFEYYYALHTPAFDALKVAGCPPACPGRLLRGPIDFRHPSNDPEEHFIDPDLKPMKLQEAVAGVEHELTNVLSIGVRYAHKQLDRGIEDVGALDADQNEIYSVANPGFGQAAFFYPAGSTETIPFPKVKRNYDSVELTLSRRMQNRWSGRVSYLWSRLFGNYAGLSETDEEGRSSPNVGRNFDYPLMSFDQNGKPVEGLLATDRTHQFKAQFVYDTPIHLSLGLNWYGATGSPRTRQAAFIPPNNFPIFYQGRNSDGRLPFLNQFDLYAQYERKLGGRLSLTVSANVMNVFNTGGAVNYFPNRIQGAGIAVTEAEFYRGVDAESLIAAQQLVLDPRFMMNSAFQDPRTIRLGAALRF